jgi:phosphate transport system substrate-binding protein
VIVAIFCDTPLRAETLRLAGSDLLGPGFSAALTTFAQRENFALEMHFEGSRSGLERLQAGAADLAFVAFAPDETAPAAPYVTQTLAYRVAVIVVPARLGITQASFTQLDGFFGARGPAGFTQWRDLGATGPAANLTATTHVFDADAAGLSHDLFSHLVLRGAGFKSSVRRHEKLETLLEALASNGGGLAILPRAPAAVADLRVLSVAKAEGEPAFGPTAQNVHAGDYPLRLPLWIVYRDADVAKLRALLNFLANDEVARALEAADWLPAPPSAQRATTAR